jgi:hypothetical protein
MVKLSGIFTPQLFNYSTILRRSLLRFARKMITPFVTTSQDSLLRL